jgi:DNA-directed RNA polymerase specialized sigma24 family protein
MRAVFPKNQQGQSILGNPKTAVVIGDDLWDFIHYNCPLSRLEAQVLVGRFILGFGERQLAAELGLPWRTVNRATWRMKAKIRTYTDALRISQQPGD